MNTRRHRWPLAPFFAFAAACTPPAVAPSSPTPTPIAATTAVPAASGGAKIAGRVLYGGDPPPVSSRPVTIDTTLCGEAARPYRALEVEPKTHGVAFAVVTVEGAGATAAALPFPSIDEARCELYPFVTLARPGDRVRVTNSDAGLHDLHLIHADGRSEHFAAPPGKANEVDVTAPERIQVVCDLHPWERAWIVVTDAPFAAVADETGRYEVDGVPPGRWTLRAWNPVVGDATAGVDVGESGVAGADVTLTPSPRLMRDTLVRPIPSPSPSPSPAP